ncbi:MAG: fusA, partial [Bacteroidetes bacterium]|nr:fusA [Bacteroidota bacterium]
MAQGTNREYSADKIRNIALVGHGGSGKTTFTEGLLFVTGTTNRLGKVDEGSTVSDYHPDEIERKISINASLLHCDWQGFKLNLLDTPGYSDFVGEVIGSLRVADVAVVLIKAVEGTEVGTEIVWNVARDYKTPSLILINKLDNENSEFDHALATAKERFGHDVAVVQFPVNEGLPFDSVVDVLRMKLLKFNRDGSGKYAEQEIPSDLKSKAESLHEELIEKIAETDEELMNKFFEDGTLKDAELLRGMRIALNTRKIFPVFCGAASMNIGLSTLLDFLTQYAPSPKDRGAVPAKDLHGKKEIIVAPVPTGQPALFVFKTVSEQHVGELSYFRVYSGSITPGMDMLNESNGKSERLGQLFL